MELAQYILFALILPSFLVFAYFLKIWWKSRTRKNFIYATLALIVFMLFLIFPFLNIYESADSSAVATSTTSFFISFNASYDVYIPLQQNAFDAAIFITLTTLGLDKLTYPPFIYSRGSIIVDLVIDVNAKIILADLVANKMFNITVANETYTASLYNATESMTSNTTFSPSISTTGAENITAQPLFYRHANGVTVLCPFADAGEHGQIDNITYYKRRINDIRDLINNFKTFLPGNKKIRKESFNFDLYHLNSTITSLLENTCTSGIFEMNDLFSNTDFNGNIDSWDVSTVYSMNNTFWNAINFNQPLNNWNVKQVTTMESMFAYALNFNQPLNNWNVTNVMRMEGTFNSATNFNQPLNNWNVGQVTTMDGMFASAINFNQPLNNWNVGQVTTMNGMFYNATNFNQSLNNWNVGQVTTIYGMFASATNFNQPLNNWNVSQVTNMRGMFDSSTNFNQSLNNWNVANVLIMSDMFAYATNFNQPLNNWNVSQVTNMNVMFYSATNFNQPLNNWNVINVLYMEQMFQGAAEFYNDNVGFKNTTCGWIINALCADCLSVAHDNCPVIIYFYRHANNVTVLCPLAEINTTGVIDGQTYTKRDRQGLQYLIANQTYWPNLTTSCTSNVADMNELFYNSNFNGDIASWDVSYVVNMNFMFYKAINFNQPLNNWNVGRVTIMDGMFAYATNFNQSLNNWNVGQVTNMQGMFASATNFNQPLNNWNVSRVTTMQAMFYSALNFNQPLNNWNVGQVTTMVGMFASATNFNQPLNNWNVSQVTTMNYMFYSATNFNQPLNNWNVINVMYMDQMFQGAAEFYNVNVGFKNTTCGWIINALCADCLSVAHDNCPVIYFYRHANNVTVLCPLAEINTTGVIYGQTYTKRDRQGLQYLIANQTYWPNLTTSCTSNVADMNELFYNSNFNGDIASWDVSYVVNMNLMFAAASNFNQPLNTWNVSRVTTMQAMFYTAKKFNQALNNWNVSKVSLMTNMFGGADSFLANNTGMKNTTCGWTFLSSCFTCLDLKSSLCS